MQYTGNDTLKWRTLGGIRISEAIEKAVERTIIAERSAGNELKICVGTDSQVRGTIIDFATVIVFIRRKRGGFMFINDEEFKGKMGIKERMLYEVSKSVGIAYHICPILERHGIELEVHADINASPMFKSNTALQEAMGYILSMGYIFKAKPEAFASSYCANKIVS